MAMNAERWQEISRLYHAALTRTPDERAAFFEKECPDDDRPQKAIEVFQAPAIGA